MFYSILKKRTRLRWTPGPLLSHFNTRTAYGRDLGAHGRDLGARGRDPVAHGRDLGARRTWTLFFKRKKTFRKEKSLKKSKLRNIWKIQTRLERGQIAPTDTCTEFRKIFRRYVIIIWKESRPQKGEHYTNANWTSLRGFCLTVWGLI